MKARLPSAPFPAGKLEQDNTFRVVIVYEDYAAGRTAMDTYQLLLSHLERERDFRVNIWSFEILQNVGIVPAAVRASVDADAIIVATHQRHGLPRAVKEWAETWAPRKREQTAVLIALFDFSQEPGTSSPTSDYLKNTAAIAGMDFLAQQPQPVTNRFSSPPEFREPRSWRAPEGWGLND